ncbi:MAG: SGNH/GDSL hydrolase family protein [Flavobacteriaceae bacterium]|nr:SGNH/GDSL hydrolase family protein [Flavobacteriaceae bacterium]
MNIFLKNTLIFIFLLTISCNPQNTSENDVGYSNIENDNFELNEIDKVNSNTSKLSFLALGDSYTIGEGVNENERWPNQFVEIANENGLEIEKPEIIAQTGWKTYDLLNAISQTNFTQKYDYVSLLIGVNNQFNSRSIDEFKEDLNKILDKINSLKKNNGNIIIISIPDWGYTPFGNSYNRESISSEINLFNNNLINFANFNGLKYVDVTEISRRALNESNLLASDNLHPSGLMYLEWAKKIYETWID